MLAFTSGFFVAKKRSIPTRNTIILTLITKKMNVISALVCLDIVFIAHKILVYVYLLRSYFGLNELKYQLWEGERYDTLEALKPCLVRYIYYFSNITPVISKASQSNSLLLNSCSISLHSNDFIQL